MPRIAAVLVLTLVCSGCLKSTTVISVRPDGTGTIVQETGLSPEALAMLQGFAGAAAGQKGGSPEIFGEAQAKKAASTMGVRFISGEPIKTAELEGYRARYAFDDISKVTVKMDQGTNDLAPGQNTKKPPFGFAFTRGSRIYKDVVATEDSLLVSRIRGAGALVIGKTNVPEFGMGSHTYNEVYGTTLNPYDTTKTAGGCGSKAPGRLRAR